MVQARTLTLLVPRQIVGLRGLSGVFSSRDLGTFWGLNPEIKPGRPTFTPRRDAGGILVLQLWLRRMELKSCIDKYTS